MLIPVYLDNSYLTPEGEVYYSTVHGSWCLRWEVAGKPYSKNITEDEAQAILDKYPD